MAFESSIVAYVSMFFLSIGVVMLQLVLTHNNALQLEEYAIAMIEHHNRYDQDIVSLIERKAGSCRSCEVEIVPMYGNGEQRYEVRIHYLVKMAPLNIRFRNSIYAVTSSVSS